MTGVQTCALPISDAPAALRERVLASFPARPSTARSFPLRAAALFLLGLTVGFAAAFAARPARVEFVDRPVEKKVEVVKEVEKPLSEDLLSNVGIAAQRVYGDLVRVSYKPRSVEIRKIVVSPIVQTYEKYCPVARQLHRCSELRPDLVEYAKSDSAPDPEKDSESAPDPKKREY